MKPNLFTFFMALALSFAATAAPPSEIGRTIFTARCASCHNVNKILVGPALAGVDQRHSLDWIVRFVQSSQTVIKSGDTAALALFEKFNHTPMPDHPDLKADDIKGIVDYIKAETKTGEDKAPFAKPTKLHPAYVPLSANNGAFFLLTGLLVAVLVLSLVGFVRVKEYERNRKNAVR